MISSKKPMPRYLLRSAFIALILCLQFSMAALERLDLGGQWQVSEGETGDWLPATVPGSVHTDLIAAKRIEDPFFRDNEVKLQWIGERTWNYQHAFTVPAEWKARETVMLRCEGLDTLATIRINGREIGKTDNMFRTWQFKANDFIQAGENRIEVRFDSVLPYIAEKERARPLPTWAHPGAAYIRKTPCNFGWDWGPTLLTCGIFRGISLMGYDTACLDNVLILQDHSRPGSVGLQVKTTAAPPTLAAPLKTRVTVTGPDGKTVASTEQTLAMGQSTGDLTISEPRLWWPSGMGSQPLYTVKTELFDPAGKLLDESTKRIGLRTMKAVQQSGDEPMHFEVNGVPFFAKGANCIPLDMFPNRVSKEAMRRHVEDAAAANMNSLRFWGGGCYEDDALFDACDELGICVWMDFKFSCGTYPAFDPAFLENVRQEARDNVQRLRHHPSIALWCGNNEIMYFRGKEEWTGEKMGEADYYRLFRDTLGEVVKVHAPQCDYVTGSPDCGDVHYWGVWHEGKPFESYGDIHGFLSEFGCQSWPGPQTVTSFTTKEDRNDVYSPIMRLHGRSGRMYLGGKEDGTIGTNKLMGLLRTYFNEPKDFESTLWLSQINQAYGIEYAANLWRREMPKSMGCVYWQYNDIWPGTSWASVDYFGRWKALHYRARHFYAPLLVSGVADSAKGTVGLWVTSDHMQPVSGELSWNVTDPSGRTLLAGTQQVTIPERRSQQVRELALSDLIQQHGAANLLVWVAFKTGGQTVSENLATFAKPKDLALLDPGLRTEVSGEGRKWTVTLHAKHPALWAWLEVTGAGARYSDNFIHLSNGGPATIVVSLDKEMSKDEFVRSLKARSLHDTFKVELDAAAR